MGRAPVMCFRSGVTSYQAPEEVLTDNGAQYVTWRGKSAFSKELEGRGIKHIVASPRHPQTLGKIERFWGSLWRECLERAVFIDLADAAKRTRPEDWSLAHPTQTLRCSFLSGAEKDG